MTKVGAPAYPTVHGPRTGRVLDLLGVYILPACCFIVDYAIGGVGASSYPLTLWTVAACGMVAFALSGKAAASPFARDIARGVLNMTWIGALLIGLVLMPVSILALAFFGLGLLGFVPLLTADRLLRRAHRLRPMDRGVSVVACLGAAMVVLASGVALSFETSGDQRREADLISRDQGRVLRALSPTSWYGPRDVIGRPTKLDSFVCQNLESFPLQDEAVSLAVRKTLSVAAQDSIEATCETRLID